jgi:23S rRNA (cytidine1920-2'-O)/16S rRNA (cytidine1409-2'-O)-methyltransferase
MKKKERIDKLLVQRGLVETRAKGQALIMAGEVRIDGEPVTKAGTTVPSDSEIEIVAPAPYVSRGGFKLAAALDEFEFNVKGLICADVGACTGGFTDVLLQNGAARIYAIDVGYGQLDWKLRTDPRVIVLERTNARTLQSLPERVGFATIDVSFISLKLILPQVKRWLDEKGNIIALVKPQFEAGREKVGKGGIVKDPRVHRAVLNDIVGWVQENGFALGGLIPSPIKGSSGNIEFLAWLKMEMEEEVEENSVIDAVMDKLKQAN